MAITHDLDPKRVMVSPDLQITGASIHEGASLQMGQTATLAVCFDVYRPVNRLSIAIRVYDTEGRCAFASRLQEHGALPLGSHCATFYFMAALPVGQYAASFEFVEWAVVADTNSTEARLVDKHADGVGCSSVASDSTHVLAKHLLGLNNIFVEFRVKDDGASARGAEDDVEFGYTPLPVQSVITDTPMLSLTCTAGASSAVATSDFPWPLPGAQFSQEELADAMHRALCPDMPSHAAIDADPRAVLKPRSAERILSAGLAPMHTQVGMISGKGVRSQDMVGCLLFGPYLPVMPGRYRVTFNGEVGPAGAPGLKFDVVAKQGRMLLGEWKSISQTSGPLKFSYEFDVQAPGYVDLELRLWVEATDDVFVENIEITPVADASTGRGAALDILVQSLVAAARRLNWLMQQSQVAMVYCPGLEWSPHILALCEQLPQQGVEWVLVVPDELDTAFLPLPKATVQTRVIKLSEALTLPKMVKCSHVVTHSFGFHDVVKKLLRHFTEAQLQLYADGFSNNERNRDVNSNVGQHGSLTGVYYFDNWPSRRLENKSIARLVDASTIFKYWAGLAEKLIPQPIDPGLEINNYVVLYLRYWGAGIYENFTTENIVKALIATLHSQRNLKRVVIVKSDPRIKPEIYAAVMDGLRTAGIRSLRFEDYLKSFGIEDKKSLLPAEVFFAKGLLCQAKAHYVLDSTMGYVIALSPAIRRPTKIIFGVDQKQMDEWESCEGTRWVKSQTQTYANMVLASKTVGVVRRRGPADVMPQIIELLEKNDI